jgi:hypothetical protein
MPITLGANVTNPALRSAAQDLVNAPRVDAAAIGKLVASFSSSQAGSTLDSLRTGALPPDQMLPLARNGLDAGKTADLKALLGDASFTAKLDATSLNFLKAVVGLEPLRAGGVFGGSAPSPVGGPDGPQAAAVGKMKEWVKSGQLSKMYEAAIGNGDAALKEEALKVFNALPAIAPGATAADFVKAGYWTAAPRGITEMTNSARYLPGRQVKVSTTVHSDLNSGQKFMTYDAAGPKGITCRATLVGEKDGKYLVQVEGKNDGPIAVDKKEIHDLNQPHSYSARTRYDDPFAKAKIAEAAIGMADDVAKLDFTKMKTERQGGVLGAMFGSGQGAETMVAIQKRCFKVIHDVIKMTYDNDGSAGRVSGDSGNAGRAAVKGYGVCTQQRQVMRDLAYPFAEIIGFDMRSVTGGVHRHTNRSAPMNDQFRSFAGAAHDWLEVTFRPSMEMTVCDRTWRQVNMPLFEAYGPYGDRYPTSAAYDATQNPLKDSDVNLTGNISVKNYEQQFGDANTSGRQNHMTNDRRTTTTTPT